MGYSLFATLSAHLDVREVADTATSPASTDGGNQRTFNQYSLDSFLKSDSFPPVGGGVVDLSFTLAGTTKDYDLTAAPLARDNGVTIDKTGAKLVGILIRMAKGNNAAGVTFGPQGGNGYALWGASKTIVLYPGTQLLHFFADPDQASLTLNTPAVGGSSKDLRFTGTVADTWKSLLIFNS